MGRHKDIAPGFVHVPYNWAYPDAATREADTSLTTDDLGKLARQEDTNALYMLTAITPTWVVIGGADGTVTNNTGDLTANALVIGNGGADAMTVLGITSDGISRLQLGVAGGAVGGVEFRNATSGTVSLVPATGALGTSVLTIPASSGTLAILASGVKQTFLPDATNAGFNPGSVAGDPSAPANGDLWYDSTGNLLRARIGGSTVSLGAGGGSPGGSDTQVQFNDSGAFGGDAGLTFNKTTNALTVTGTLFTATGTTSIASLNIPHGAAPTSPTNGDVWTTTAGLYVRVNGSTVGPVGSGGGTPGGSDTQIQFNDGGVFGGDSGLVFTKTTGRMTLKSPTAQTPIFTIDTTDATGSTSFLSFALAGTNKGHIGIAGANDAGVTGSVTGQMFIRANASPLIISGDGGASANMIISGSGSSGVWSGSGPIIINPTSTNALTLQANTLVMTGNGTGTTGVTVVAYQREGTTKAFLAVAGASDHFITGSIQDDQLFRTQGFNFIVSTDSGSSIALKVVASTGQVVAEKTTASTSTTTGALISKGGLGVAGAGWFGTDVVATTFLVGLTNSAALSWSSGDLILQSYAAGNTHIKLAPFGTGSAYMGTKTSSAITGVFGVYGAGQVDGSAGLRVASANTQAPYFMLSKGRGSLASPGQTLSGDTLGGVFFGGYHSSNAWNEYSALIEVVATENFTSGAVGSKFQFSVPPNGSTTYALALTISSAGIRTATPAGGTAADWKLGSRVATTVAFDTSQYIELDVGGTLYKVAIAT